MNPAQFLDGRVASLLLAGGMLNGLAYRLVEEWRADGLDAPSEFFSVSPFELLVAGVGIRLLWAAGPFVGKVGGAATALYMLLMLWPSSLIAWLLVTALATGMAFRLRGPARSGAVLFAALGAWEVWSAVLEPMAAGSILSLDAGIVAALLSAVRENVFRIGNVVGAADGHRIVVIVGCSTAHILPLAVLGASGLVLIRGERLGLAAIAGLAGLAVALAAMNLCRLTLMAWSADLYHIVHSSTGAMVFDALTSHAVVAAALAIPTLRTGVPP